ncbi:HvfC/BufC N-terminal domain-containing protein [Seohaeicola zhoushanensis]|uniref:DUF2063 domain-containing protein n=1 Tax=Seohaeicola zhoushanensis TaxID=1569283 RepID=A0A8J3H1M9_9RHOB|nr:DNA-binding domain-containing protein [Seohaeicola zhoushanensis]GHF73455.1 DUF2063 domain-containing protein [Seohaeicola zhoushanensis]
MTAREDAFVAALLDAAQPAPEGLRDAAGGPAGKRFDVYRNNVAVSLTEALLTGFPVITRLLGQANMKGLAGIFLRAHPPASPLLMHYGAGFPEFLEGMEQLAHLGYLGDVARLELALRRSYHAADASPIPPEALEADPEALVGAKFGFAPAVELLRSDWPLHGIWRFNTEEDAPKPRPVAEDVLVLRPEFDPEPHLLPPGGADWIGALTAGATLDEAMDAAPGFDPGPCLALLLRGNAITSVTLPETTA